MSITEVKVWQIMCDVCRRPGPVVMSEHRPGLPQGWSWRTIGDYGMCGGTVHDVRCENCTHRQERQEQAA